MKRSKKIITNNRYPMRRGSEAPPDLSGGGERVRGHTDDFLCVGANSELRYKQLELFEHLTGAQPILCEKGGFCQSKGSGSLICRKCGK